MSRANDHAVHLARLPAHADHTYAWLTTTQTSRVQCSHLSSAARPHRSLRVFWATCALDAPRLGVFLPPRWMVPPPWPGMPVAGGRLARDGRESHGGPGELVTALPLGFSDGAERVPFMKQ